MDNSTPKINTQNKFKNYGLSRLFFGLIALIILIIFVIIISDIFCYFKCVWQPANFQCYKECALKNYLLKINYNNSNQPEQKNLNNQVPAINIPQEGEQYLDETLSEETDNYSLQIYYPSIILKTDEEKVQKINKTIKDLVDLEINNFKTNIVNIPVAIDSGKNFMTLDYNFSLLDDNILSLYFINEFYASGAAHPNTNFTVLNYDLIQEKNITLQDLLASNNYDKISQLCSDNLKNQIEPYDLFSEGLDPKPENFSKFNISQNKISFLFDPYQVAPYAAGSQIVELPFDLLASILEQNSVIKYLLPQN